MGRPSTISAPSSRMSSATPRTPATSTRRPSVADRARQRSSPPDPGAAPSRWRGPARRAPPPDPAAPALQRKGGGIKSGKVDWFTLTPTPRTMGRMRPAVPGPSSSSARIPATFLCSAVTRSLGHFTRRSNASAIAAAHTMMYPPDPAVPGAQGRAEQEVLAGGVQVRPRRPRSAVWCSVTTRDPGMADRANAPPLPSKAIRGHTRGIWTGRPSTRRRLAASSDMRPPIAALARPTG